VRARPHGVAPSVVHPAPGRAGHGPELSRVVRKPRGGADEAQGPHYSRVVRDSSGPTRTNGAGSSAWLTTSSTLARLILNPIDSYLW